MQADFEADAVRDAVGSPPMQLALFTVPAGSATPLDRHEVRELWLVQRGRGLVRCGGREFEAGPGRLFALPSGEEHEFVALDEDVDVVSLWWRG